MKKSGYLLSFLAVVLFLILLNTSFYFRESFVLPESGNFYNTVLGIFKYNPILGNLN
jgi:hypothetical protein